MAGTSVHLPLERFDRCSVCQKTSGLHFCSRCGERIYCSRECQTGDWPSHKKSCGKTDKLDLGMFHPFLATLHDVMSMDTGTKPLHPAMRHQIINSPDPEGPATTFPDGTSAKLIILGKSINDVDLVMGKWWPNPPSPKVMSKMQRRIMREGWLLQKVMAVCMALLEEVYTTTYVPSSQSEDGDAKHRVRLYYRTSPIADFGIIKGEAFVPPQDELAYLYTEEDRFSRGQDPKDHYWIYFKTVRGEEVALDCGYFTFNLCNIISSDNYTVDGLPSAGWAPDLFIDRNLARDAPMCVLHTPKQQFSVLRSAKLSEAVKNQDVEPILEFMDEVAGRKCSDVEKVTCRRWISLGCSALESVIEDQVWKNWPRADAIVVAAETDPNEKIELTEEESKKMNRLIKLNRQVNRGKISQEKWRDSIKKWKAEVGIKT